jgi:hypothetical protein
MGIAQSSRGCGAVEEWSCRGSEKHSCHARAKRKAGRNGLGAADRGAYRGAWSGNVQNMMTPPQPDPMPAGAVTPGR